MLPENGSRLGWRPACTVFVQPPDGGGEGRVAMFDLITGTATHIPRHPRGPMLVSTGIQVTILGLVVLVPVLFVTHALPQPPTMMAFVAAPPPPPPPPPPPAPPQAAKKAAPAAAAAPTASAFAAP